MEAATLAGRRSATRRLLNPARLRDGGIVVSFLTVFLALSLSSGAFLTKANLLNILDQQAGTGVIALGVTVVVIGGGFDLSVGAGMALCGVVAAYVATHVGVGAGLLLGVLSGVLLGAFNGWLVVGMGVSAFVATLAAGLMFRGAAELITDGQLISVTSPGFATLGQDELLGVKLTVLVLALSFVVVSLLLSQTSFGRWLYATGGNDEAAHLSGVPVSRVRVISFLICGLAVGLAGAIETSRVATGQADTGVGLELTAMAAVVVGGTSIAGGQGAAWRTLLGLLLLALIDNGFNLLGVAPTYQQLVRGALIVGAVALDARARRR
ncbi:Ribose import permease protein RbsC [Baekduia alba]|uniref:ABC transporter permease n=1 Tax=Baekduia alba TaxID=2997333 RepID=UPI00233FEBFC|nr:ABC transporter permease [Baekduia alba]WCB92262.1 Ribose import permease protein RbsC [Baekduia alba]